MQRIILAIFIILTFLCSPAISANGTNWVKKANALWDGKKYTNPKKAIEYLSNFIKQKPDAAVAYYNRAIAYGQIGQHKRALEDYNQIIRLKPDTAVAYYNRAIVYSQMGQHKRALADYNQTIRLKPDLAQAYINRGVIHLNQGNKKLGCSDAQKACRLKNCLLLDMAKVKGFCK